MLSQRPPSFLHYATTGSAHRWQNVTPLNNALQTRKTKLLRWRFQSLRQKNGQGWLSSLFSYLSFVRVARVPEIAIGKASVYALSRLFLPFALSPAVFHVRTNTHAAFCSVGEMAAVRLSLLSRRLLKRFRVPVRRVQGFRRFLFLCSCELATVGCAVMGVGLGAEVDWDSLGEASKRWR